MHSLVERQLKKSKISDGSVDLDKFCSLVSTAYEENEKSRRLSDRSVELMSQEMLELNTALRSRASEISAIINSVKDTILVASLQGQVLSINEPGKAMFGYSQINIVEKNLSDIFPDFDFENLKGKDILLKEKVEDVFTRAHDTIGLRHDGTKFPAEIYIKPMQSSETSSFACVVRDITVEKEQEEKLFKAAFYDALTGLPNRALFNDRLQESLKKTKRLDGNYAALLFIDLDRFKVINDSLGHEAGDELLKQVAQRFSRILRHYDTVARLGGDEFTVLLNEIVEPQHAEIIAERHLQALEAPFNLLGREVHISASIGLSIISPGDDLCEDILRNADLAMYEAKNAGRGRLRKFHEDQHKSMMTRLEVESELRRAIVQNEIAVYYQPIIYLNSGEIAGFEALSRWLHPEKGLIPPNEFIPVAEETNLIQELGNHVLEKACKQIKIWSGDASVKDPIFVAVNLSPLQMSDSSSGDQVIDIIQKSGLEKGQLKIECTESALMKNPEYAKVFFENLKALGVQLCIDDFGTGYSALEYLHRYPFDILKIDRHFISSMTQEEKDLRLVGGMISLAHSLGLQVVAEGVERDIELQNLVKLQADMVQGYYFAKPLTLIEATSLLTAGTKYPVHFLEHKAS